MKKLTTISICSGGVLLAVFSVATAASSSSSYKLVGWNDLGMHCVDGNDYSVFSILPPYNNVHAQLIDPNGKLVKSPSGIRLTYEAVADPSGSINRTSVGKTNFWQYVNPLFGVSLAPDMGLAGHAMPGSRNKPQAMSWNLAKYEFVAEGVPITPYPDNPPTAGAKNYYPLMRLVARNSSNRVLATADVVLPVSDEMACSACHASGSITDSRAMPSQLAFNSDPDKDYKLNILQLHDDRQGTHLMTSQPVLCASCHGSNALGTKGTAKPLTQVLHTKHAAVIETGAEATREACYNCHPGSVTKCLRGAMGNAGMQCQNCHGSMAEVGASTRRGWLDEPGCENCHTGTAVKNSGQIRYTDAFAYAGTLRQAADPRFAVTANTLYRLSAGHGKLACEACHGSTHAEYPSSHENDNLMVTRLQGHSGTLSECKSCHPSNIEGGVGPHGMHPADSWWIDKHHDAVEKQGLGSCRDCHGGDLRGTVLSAALTDRTISMGEHGTKTFAKGTVIGCYTCHNGPNP